MKLFAVPPFEPVKALHDRCRLVSKTSTRLALTPVYLPYINRMLGVNGYFGAKILRLLLFGSVFQRCCLRLRNAGKTPVCLSDDEVIESGMERREGQFAAIF